MPITELRGSSQIKDITVTRPKLVADFLNATDWNITNGNNNATITGLSDGVNARDAVNFQQFENALNGRAWKVPVKALAESGGGGNVTLNGAQTIDGIACAVGDIVAVFDQTTAAEDGVWEVAAAGWTRHAQWPAGADPASYSFMVEEGTANADTQWTVTDNTGAGVIATNGFSVVKTSSNAVITAGNGLTLTGNVLDVISANAGIVANANDITLTAGTTNGNSLEVTATGVELLATVTDNRTFNAGNFVVDSGAGNTASISGFAGLSLASVGGDVDFSDSEVDAAIVTTPIPFALTATVNYGNGNTTIAGGVIDQFRTEFTDDGIVNAIVELKALLDNQVSKLTPYVNELPTVTNGSADVTLANLGTHATDKVALVKVYLNGVKQSPGGTNDYTLNVLSGVITFNFNLTTGDVVNCDYSSQDA